MTLCIAAVCCEDESRNPRLVFCADKRAEVGWAGGEVGWKIKIGGINLFALVAGEISKAEDLLATSRDLTLGFRPSVTDNLFDKFNQISSAHKKKLCERYVEQRLGMDFERFLTKGAKELTSEIRNQVLHRLSELEFGCELLLLGFSDNDPFIFEINQDGEVQHDNFGAIGTGSVIAKSILYQRRQYMNQTIPSTLYNLYEASRLARIAPGVGEITEFAVMQRKVEEQSVNPVRMTTPAGIQVLEETFKIVGPQTLTIPPVMDESCFRWVGGSQPKQAQATGVGELSEGGG